VTLAGQPADPGLPAPAPETWNRPCNPTDIAFFHGRYVTPELIANRLAHFADLSFSDLRRFDPASIGQAFHAPHYLAVSPTNTLLITDGWGTRIIEIQDLEGRGWRTFQGIGQPLNAPHGICVDTNGWIYVADSLNSRLVRFRDLNGTGWEVFQDTTRKISYGRQLVFANGCLWLSNSYEQKPGSPPGAGGNVLKIADFDSGIAEEVAAIPTSNITALLPLDEHRLLVGVWGFFQLFGLVDTRSRGLTLLESSRLNLGAPYSAFRDPRTGRVLVCYFGDFADQGRANRGGLAIFNPPEFIPLPALTPPPP
jgi:hypothetical protein